MAVQEIFEAADIFFMEPPQFTLMFSARFGWP